MRSGRRLMGKARRAARGLRARMLVLAAALVVVGGSASVMAAPAQAYTYYVYCNGVYEVYPNACGGLGVSRGGWDKNFEDYYGSGTAHPCESASDDNGNLWSSRCALQNHINSSTDLYAAWNGGIYTTLYVGMYPGSPGHTVSGTGRFP
jgi:hypothetical protein